MIILRILTSLIGVLFFLILFTVLYVLISCGIWSEFWRLLRTGSRFPKKYRRVE